MNKDPVLSEIDFQLRQFQTDNKYIDYDDNCVVPVSTLLGFKHIKSHFTEDKLRWEHTLLLFTTCILTRRAKHHENIPSI